MFHDASLCSPAVMGVRERVPPCTAAGPGTTDPCRHKVAGGKDGSSPGREDQRPLARAMRRRREMMNPIPQPRWLNGAVPRQELFSNIPWPWAHPSYNPASGSLLCQAVTTSFSAPCASISWALLLALVVPCSPAGGVALTPA